MSSSRARPGPRRAARVLGLARTGLGVDVAMLRYPKGVARFSGVDDSAPALSMISVVGALEERGRRLRGHHGEPGTGGGLPLLARLLPLPGVMAHVREVRTSDGGARLHWVAEAPGKLTVEWDAEVVEDSPGSLLR